MIKADQEQKLSALLKDAVPAGQERRVPEASTPPAPVDVLYLFLLDTSASASGRTSVPPWFDPVLSRLEPHLSAEELKSLQQSAPARNGTRPTDVMTFDLARVRLADLLISLAPRHPVRESEVRENFAVWRMGDKADVVFPKDPRDPCVAPLTTDNAIAAIREISIQSNQEPNTNFVSAIKRLKEKYPDFFEVREVVASPRIVVLTILSDFVHDVDNLPRYRDRLIRVEEEWDALEQEIRNQSHMNVVANLLVVTETGRVDEQPHPTHRQIATPYQSTFLPSKYSLNGISTEVQTRLLYPPMKVREPIRFHWERRAFLSTLTLSLDNKASPNSNELGELLIVVPDTVDHREQPPFVMRWELLTDVQPGTNVRDVSSLGWISSRGDVFAGEQVRPHNRLRLVVESDPLDLQGRRIQAKVVNGSDRRVYNVDIEFVRVMPLLYAGLVSALEVLLAFLLITFLLRLIRQGWGYLRSRRRPKNSTPLGGKASEVEGIWASHQEVLTLNRDGLFGRVPEDHSIQMERGNWSLREDGTVMRFEVRDAILDGGLFHPPHVRDAKIVERDGHSLVLSYDGTENRYERRLPP